MSIIKKYVDKLVDLMVYKGTPPFILANNIGLDNYLEVNLTKINKQIIVTSKCKKDQEIITFKYYYNENEVLYKKEVFEKGNNYIYWDRKKEMKKLLQKIINLSGNKYRYNLNDDNLSSVAKKLIREVS